MATLYVSTSGNDTIGDGSILLPWRNLKKAVDAGNSNTIEFVEAAAAYVMAADINANTRSGTVIHGNNTTHTRSSAGTAFRLGSGFSLSDIDISSNSTNSGGCAIGSVAEGTLTFSGVIGRATGNRSGFNLDLTGANALAATNSQALGAEYGAFITGDGTSTLVITGGTYSTNGVYNSSGSAGLLMAGHLSGSVTNATLHGQIDSTSSGDFAVAFQCDTGVYTLTNCPMSATRGSYPDNFFGLGYAGGVYAGQLATVIIYGGSITTSCPSGEYDLVAGSESDVGVGDGGVIYVRSDVSYDPAKVLIGASASIGVINAPTLSSRTETTLTITTAGVTGGGRTPITLQLQQSAHSADSFSDVVGKTSSPATVTGLTEGTTYDYRWKFTDADGTVLYSTTLAATPGPPFVPSSRLGVGIGIGL